MITARVRIEGDNQDWFGGDCVFPVMPPMGAHLSIIDKNANRRHLVVQRIVVGGATAVMQTEQPALMDWELATYLYCTEYREGL